MTDVVLVFSVSGEICLAVPELVRNCTLQRRSSDPNIQCKVTTLFYPTASHLIMYRIFTAERGQSPLSWFRKALVRVNTGHTVRSGYKNKSVHTSTKPSALHTLRFHVEAEVAEIRKLLVSSYCPGKKTLTFSV